jgi:hypothetical protein
VTCLTPAYVVIRASIHRGGRRVPVVATGKGWYFRGEVDFDSVVAETADGAPISLTDEEAASVRRFMAVEAWL